MKMFSNDKNEWENIKNEFDQTLVAKNLLAVNRGTEVCILTVIIVLIIGLFFEDLTELEENIAFLFIFLTALIELIVKVMIRISYYNFMYKFEKNKNTK